MSDALENARLAVEHDADSLWAESADRDELNRLWRAMMLSPSIEVCEALLRSESVPLGRLDPEWVRRLGLREAA